MDNEKCLKTSEFVVVPHTHQNIGRGFVFQQDYKFVSLSDQVNDHVNANSLNVIHSTGGTIGVLETDI